MTSPENSEQGTNWTQWLEESQLARDERAVQDIARDLEAQEAAGYKFVSSEDVEHLVKSLGRLAGTREFAIHSNSDVLNFLSEDLGEFRTMDSLVNENEELTEENEKARGLKGLLVEATDALKLVPGYEGLVERLLEAQALLQRNSGEGQNTNK